MHGHVDVVPGKDGAGTIVASTGAHVVVNGVNLGRRIVTALATLALAGLARTLATLAAFGFAQRRKERLTTTALALASSFGSSLGFASVSYAALRMRPARQARIGGSSTRQGETETVKTCFKTSCKQL